MVSFKNCIGHNCGLKSPFSLLKVISQRDHPFKTSACHREGGVSPLPTFADARGGGVSGMPTSAIFDIIRRQIPISIYILGYFLYNFSL